MASIAAACPAIAKATSLNPLLWATMLGMAASSVCPVSVATDFNPGVKFVKARILRLGIILYGVRLTVQQLMGIGMAGLLADIFAVSSTLWLGIFLGDKLRLKTSTSALISTASAICGVSAAIAAQPAVGGEPHEVATAVGVTVLCGTSAMFLYPLLWRCIPMLSSSPKVMGIYTGATVHELAGVVGAGNAMTPEIATDALVTKMLRICMLVPVFFILPFIMGGRVGEASDGKGTASRGRPPMPWFICGFVAVTILNSLVHFSPSNVALATKASAFSLAMAMAALGFDVDLKKIRQLGPRPIVLSLALWAHLIVSGALASWAFVALFP